MEPRKITIIQTREQKKSVIMSEATTLEELKRDLRLNNIDYTDMAFYEGVSKIELKSDDSILPQNVPYKGIITNELVFMLTNTNKKIKSGMAMCTSMTRSEAYTKIKQMNLQKKCVEKYGKNYTQCKTEDLVKIIKECNLEMPQEEKTHCCNSETDIKFKVSEDNIEIANNSTLVTDILRIIYDYKLADKEQVYDIMSSFDSNRKVNMGLGNTKHSEESPYSDLDIEDMFEDMEL